MRALLTASLLFLAAARGWAQMEVGAAVGPDMLGGKSGSETMRSTATPLALALSLSIGSATWSTVGLSTAGTQAAEIDRFMGKGYYLLAERSALTLGVLDARREKGESLREIAQSLSVEYDALYEEALLRERAVQERMRSLLRIEAVGPGRGP